MPAPLLSRPPAGLRTPDSRFAGLVGYRYPPRYIDIDGLRMHYVDTGPPTAPPVVLLHGEPTWSYLYRHMIDGLAADGHRVLAPDFIGFGRSDKPRHVADHDYGRHVRWATRWFDALALDRVTLFCQDWGALIGLRCVAAMPARFARVIVANGFLPTGDEATPWLFRLWRAFARYSPVFPVGALVQAGSRRWLSAAERRAYRAPFPDARYMAAVRAMPRLVPMQPNDPASADNHRAWARLAEFQRPFHTCFAAGDPITRPAARAFRERVPGAAGVGHATLTRARHFIQEDRPEALLAFIRSVVTHAAR